MRVAARWAVIILFWAFIKLILGEEENRNAPCLVEDSIHDWSIMVRNLLARGED